VGQRKSGMTVLVPIWSGTLTCGCWRPPRRMRSRTTSSRTLRVGAGPVARMRVSLRGLCEEVAWVDEAEGLGLADGSFEALVGEGGREVFEGSGRCRRWDASVDNGSIEGEVGCAAGAQAGVVVRRGCGHLDSAVVPVEDAPEHGGGEVAQEGAWAAGLGRGEEAALERDVVVADGVDAVVDAVQPAALDAARDHPGRQSARLELGGRDHAPLSRRPFGDERVDKCTSTVHFSTRGGHGHTVAGKPSRNKASMLRIRHPTSSMQAVST
jgi:hypothetical protein